MGYTVRRKGYERGRKRVFVVMKYCYPFFTHNLPFSSNSSTFSTPFSSRSSTLSPPLTNIPFIYPSFLRVYGCKLRLVLLNVPFPSCLKVVLLNVSLPRLLKFQRCIDNRRGFQGCFCGYNDSLIILLHNY